VSVTIFYLALAAPEWFFLLTEFPLRQQKSLCHLLSAVLLEVISIFQFAI
jgi:hypothetical protein